jgi:hypothetical protein
MSVAALLSILTAISGNTSRSNTFIANNTSPIMIFFPTALGYFAMMVTLCYFVATEVTNDFFVFISVTAAIWGLLGAMSLAFSSFYGPELDESTRPKRPTWFGFLLSRVGLPALYGGLYCSRSAGWFCLSVSIILVVSKILGDFLAVAILVAPATIILISVVFLAGARSMVGAGAFAIVVALGVTSYTYFYHQNLFFGKWAFVFVFWIALPFTCAFFDWIRWTVVRAYISITRKTAGVRQGITFVMFILGDIAFAVVCIVGFAVITAMSINEFNHFAVGHGYPEPISLRQIVTQMHNNDHNAGVWYWLLVAAFLVPTFVSISLYASSGLINLVPYPTRLKLSNEILDVEPSDNRQRDILAWKLSAIESLTGILFFISTIVGVAYFLSWIGRPFGELLYSAVVKII